MLPSRKQGVTLFERVRPPLLYVVAQFAAEK